MNRDTVIFDMDGVIFDTERIYLDIWKKIYPKHGYEMTLEFYLTLIGRDRKTCIKLLSDHFGNNFPGEKIFAECDEALKKAIDNGQVPMKTGALEIINYLKSNDYKIAIATSSPRHKLDMQLKIHSLQNIFDAIICADDVERSKPDPDIFLKAAKKLNKRPEQCIVIEDSPSGIIAAYSAQMLPFHVEDLLAPTYEIIKYSNCQFKNLIEVKEYISKHINAL